MTDENFFDVPPEHEAGAYANAFSIWHGMSDFTIDFAVSQSPSTDTALVVSRVRIPTTYAFELIRRVNDAMAQYEEEWGAIVIPQPKRPENP